SLFVLRSSLPLSGSRTGSTKRPDGRESFPTGTKKQIWQRRFWDHIIRDRDDFNKHIDYIHYNPVKHRLLKNPFEWQYSSIQLFKKDGIYKDDWGVAEEIHINGDFEEI
ncbi:MAG: hypothetical protein ABIJ45_12685, partial [Candidatus Zixiibacteriota bacterium]